jgi:hypothetical protein
MSLIRREKQQIHEEILAEVNFHAAHEAKRAARSLRYNYIWHYVDRTAPVLPNCDDGLSKTYWLDHG